VSQKLHTHTKHRVRSPPLAHTSSTLGCWSA